LFGQTVCPETLKLNNDFTLIAYFLKPFAITALFGITASELTDKPIELNLINPSTTSSLQERLLNASSTKEMMLLIDSYIYNLITKVKTDIRILKYAIEKIASNPNKDILVSTQQELCITERTFQRLFENHLGVSPNQYRRIAQFHSAFQQLQRRQFQQLSDIAFTNCYADQSHYIRTFKEFTNLSPKQYLQYGMAD
jgi:AraC-like DNA-binding protein